ncbi:hypothetical protein FGG08_006802 [Glutinoglossum americanum]|uniref:Serine/threonine-protein kinase n=1 Tax=Glutinoglossum americanum TaxID=1670608 RepID=A0A9P8I0R7_9PEZI|nr:hypothetical protein FGG08_006802 [Glutinoglossum americanum]
MEPLGTRSANAVPKSKPASNKEAAAQQERLELDRKEQRARIHPEDPPRYVQEPCGSDGQEGQKYAVEGYLGAGGFAKCWQAELRDSRTRRTGERVALKVVRADMGSKKMREKFRSELQVHSKMHHPNIVDFHRSFTFKNNTYVVLELCENRSLMEMVKARKYLTGPEIRVFTIQTAGAIKYMHLKNVIHRDLKMGNIFLDSNMNIKVGDFGLAALLYSPEGRRTTICGTPNYIAPEILEKGKNGHNFEVDLYAMLVGTPPFQANTQEDIYKKVRLRDYGWPPEEKRFIADEAKDLVASLLVEAGNRLTPDDIVEHDFISKGCFLDEILPEYRHCAPELPEWSVMNTKAEKVRYMKLYEEYCRKAGVGKDINGQLWPCVGTDGGKEIIAEIQEEDLNGLAPVPGSPSVYKGSRSALAPRPGTKIPSFRDVAPATTTTARHQSGFPKTITVPTLPDVYKQPIRPKQSRAAELRELNRPATVAFPKSIMKDIPNRNELLQAPPQRPATTAATGQGLLETAPRRPSPKDKMEHLENQRPERPLTRSVTASAALARPSDATATRGTGTIRSASAGATGKSGREVGSPVKAKTEPTNAKGNTTVKPKSEHLLEAKAKPAADAKAKTSTKSRSAPLGEMETKPTIDTKVKTERKPSADTKTKAATKSRQEPSSELDVKSESLAKAVAKFRFEAGLEPKIAAEPKRKTAAKSRSDRQTEVEQLPVDELKTRTTAKLRSERLAETEPVPATEVKPEQKVGDKQLTRSRGPTASAPNKGPEDRNVSKAEDSALVNNGEAAKATRKPPAKPRKKQPPTIYQTRLVSPNDDAEILPRTRPEDVLRSCTTLHTNLRKAMNFERYGDELAQVKQQQVKKEPNYVVKWVDYTTKFGIGYILKDGTIGCLFNENGAPPTSVVVRAAERHVSSWACSDYADRQQTVPPKGFPIEFLESLGEAGIVRAFVSPREYKVGIGESGVAEKLGPGKDSFDDLKRKEVVLWRKFANYMSETLGKTEKEKYRKPGMKPTDTIVTFYQRFGDVGVWGFADGSFQFNFPDHTKILLSHDGLHCYFLHLPVRPAEALAKSGTPIPSEVLMGRSVMSHPTHVFFRGQADGKEFSDVMEANRFRSKMSFVRDVIGEWIALGGIGRGVDDPDKDLRRWTGPRERRTAKKDPTTKMVWVTVGARGGDQPALETTM